MKIRAATAAAAWLGGVAMAGIMAVTEGARDRMSVLVNDESSTFKFGEIKVNMDKYDDGRTHPHWVVFWKDGVRSRFFFKADGALGKFKVGEPEGEYRVEYDASGNIEKVVTVEMSDGKGRFFEAGTYDCDECYADFEMLMCFGGKGFDTVTLLRDSGLAPAGQATEYVEYMWHAMYWACYNYWPTEGCDSQCSAA